MSIKDDRKRASKEERTRKDSQRDVVAKSEVRDPRLRLVIAFMHANLHRKIALSDLASHIGLSTDHLSRLFKSKVGLTVSAYLIGLRMKKARELLTEGLLSIKEVMAATGYRNRGHFLEHYKRSFGPTPSEYRKSVLG